MNDTQPYFTVADLHGKSVTEVADFIQEWQDEVTMNPFGEACDLLIAVRDYLREAK